MVVRWDMLTFSVHNDTREVVAIKMIGGEATHAVLTQQTSSRVKTTSPRYRPKLLTCLPAPPIA